MVLKSYKFRLYPTFQQKILIEKHFGCARFVYNKALELKICLYKENNKGISVFNLMKEMARWKDREEMKWLSEVAAQSLQASIKNLDSAFTGFFKKKSEFPKFKNKNKNNFSFSIPQYSSIDFDKKLFYTIKFKEGIECIFDRQFEGKIKTCTVSKTPTGKYFVSILVEESGSHPVPSKPQESKTLGLDLGVKTFLTDSEGNKTDNPKHFKKRYKQLKRAQRKFSRCKKRSKNREKQRKRVAIIHEKITNSRKDFLHKLTHKLTENQGFDSFAIEDLSVKDMLEKSGKNLARSIQDCGWGTFREFLQYKCKRTGKNLLVIGRFEPSSKLCSCGSINKDLKLSDREWDCKACGTHHDRDILAAQNIKHFAFCKQNTSSKKEYIPVAKRNKTSKKPAPQGTESPLVERTKIPQELRESKSVKCCISDTLKQKI